MSVNLSPLVVLSPGVRQHVKVWFNEEISFQSIICLPIGWREQLNGYTARAWCMLLTTGSGVPGHKGRSGTRLACNAEKKQRRMQLTDRKSTRLNSSHS